MEKYFLPFVFLLVGFLNTELQQAQTIAYVSKPSGGFWNDTATWQGGQIPPAGSDIVITGPVTLQGGITCRNLRISSNGSLANLPGTCGYIEITDTLYNEGTITTNEPDYYCYGHRLDISLKGHIMRLGKFTATYTYIEGEKDHEYYNPGNDTIRSYVEFKDSASLNCHGPLIFGGRMINGIINLNKFQLTVLSGGSMEYDSNKKPYFSVLRNARKIVAEKGSLIGNYETEKFHIYGDTITLHGYFTSAGLTFYGDVFNYDTLANNGEKWKSVVGNFTNFGTIVNITGWHWSHSIMVSGNILNQGSWFTSWLVLAGKNPRNIQLNSGVTEQVYFLDSLTLVGYNTLPGLRPYPWADPQPICTVSPNATLVIGNPDINPAVVSFGQIKSSLSEISYYDQALPHMAIHRNPASTVSSIEGISFSRQYHRFFNSGLKHYWILKNTPRNYDDLLYYAYFYYTDDEAEGIDESQLKIFYSIDGGLTWKWVSSFNVNPSANWIKANNIPSAAQYVITTDRIDTLLAAKIGVSSLSPRRISSGNTNPSLITIQGKGFTNETRVVFRNKDKTLTPDTIFLTGLHGTSLKVLLRTNTVNKIETYDLVVTNPDQPEVILPSALEVNPYAYAIPWFVLGGRDRTLANRWQTFEFSYGNTGLADAWGVPVFFAIKDQPGMQVAFPDFVPEIPTYAYEYEHSFLKDSSLYFLTDSLFEEPGPWRIYGFYIPHIPAVSSQISRIKILAPSDIDLQAWIINPYNPPIFVGEFSGLKDGTELNACLTAFAMKSFAMNIVGQLPGVGCVSSLAEKYFDPAGYITGTNQENDNSWGSLLWSASSWALAIGNCAADVVPVGKAVKIAAGIASFIADIKENYDADQKCRNKYDRKRLRTRTVYSVDPNEKTGNSGSGDARFVNTDAMSYTIFFENKSSATSSALEVFITDTLSPSLFDLKTVRFTAFSFGDTLITIQEDSLHVSRFVYLPPPKDIILSFQAEADTNTGILRWAFRSLDPVTGELTEDPDAGFLPPNINSPEGEGYVTFTVSLQPDVPDNTQVSNKACIVFDLNEPIVTNTFTNTIDKTPPVSNISASYAQNDNVITILVDGTDAASGVASFEISISYNGEEPVPWKTLYTSREASFVPPANGIWKFISRATDYAGNKEFLQELHASQVVVTNANEPKYRNNAITVYPNPVHSNLYITRQTMENIPYEIISTEGNCLKKGYLKQTHEQIDVSSLPAGIYLLRIIHKNSVTTRRLVVL